MQRVSTRSYKRSREQGRPSCLSHSEYLRQSKEISFICQSPHPSSRPTSHPTLPTDQSIKGHVGARKENLADIRRPPLAVGHGLITVFGLDTLVPQQRP